ncbi:hypothetical protein BDN70DRAFT_933970 [Pholiota conissans]|uniref:Uncharacterized protein n=1 Tax=Pholiota conissans TaxID=109636 RepID=A0A9P5YYE8_9AGAR|nr:hypothetical protein BDN70DRAFT_933970 [Pholiota conissans]
MHFSRLITAIVLVAVTGVLASSPIHEDNEKIVDVRRRESTLAAEAVDTAGMDATPGCDDPEADESGMDDYSDSMEEDNVSPAMTAVESAPVATASWRIDAVAGGAGALYAAAASEPSVAAAIIGQTIKWMLKPRGKI